MTQPDDVVRARTRHSRLIDLGATEGTAHLDISADQRTDELRSHLTARFQDRPDLDRITLRLDGACVGVTTRSLVLSNPGTAAEPLSLGGADHASLPGLSQQYVVIRFACTALGCGSQAVRSFYDSRSIPRCGIAAHGELAVQR